MKFPHCGMYLPLRFYVKSTFLGHCILFLDLRPARQDGEPHPPGFQMQRPQIAWAVTKISHLSKDAITVGPVEKYIVVGVQTTSALYPNSV